MPSKTKPCVASCWRCFPMVGTSRLPATFTANPAANPWTTTGAFCTRFQATGRIAPASAIRWCKCRSESMDDHWRVLHALPGDGQNRPSVGDSLVQVQERYNVLSNMQAETYDSGIPP